MINEIRAALWDKDEDQKIPGLRHEKATAK